MWWMTFVIAPILGGILAASGFILAKRPDAKEYIDKIAPYQGAIGATMLFAFVWNVVKFKVLSILGPLFSASPVRGITLVMLLASLLLVGFLLSYGLIASKMGGAAEKAERVQKKLAAIQAPLGLVSIVAGVLTAVLLR